MLNILLPSEAEQRAIQQTERRYYWSAAAEVLFRKHGRIGVRAAENADDGLAIVTRGKNPAERFGQAGFYEGPLTPAALRKLGLAGEERIADTLEVFDASGRRIANLTYPAVRARRIPVRRGEASEPYEYVNRDPMWRRAKLRYQVLTGAGWHSVLIASAEQPSEKALPVAVTDGERTVTGIPVFDLIAAAHAFEPLEVGYYSHIVSPSLFGFELWLVRQVEALAMRQGIPVVEVARWPRDFAAALTIRHDYDRLITDRSLDELLDFYRQRRLRTSWGFLRDKWEPTHALRLLCAGHEVAIHSVANNGAGLLAELAVLNQGIQQKIHGLTAHGGIGAPGFLGDLHYQWSEDAGLSYCEMLGRRNVLPHPVIRVRNGLVTTGRLTVPATHLSLDKGSKPEAHNLEIVTAAAFRTLAEGGNVNVMNHPDIHRTQLYGLLDGLPLDDLWVPTLAELDRWLRATKLDSRTASDGRIVFGEPLAQPCRVTVHLPGGLDEQFVARAGEQQIACPAAGNKYVC